MAFALVQSATKDDGTATVALTGVGAGNLIVLWCKWEDPTVGTDAATATDGTTSLTMGTNSGGAAGGPHGQFGYLLSANGGNKTYTVTYPAGAAFVSQRIYEFSYTGTASFDVQNIGRGTSTGPVSGVVTTTGTDEAVFGGYSEYSPAVFSAPLINAVAADGTIGTGGTARLWYRTLTATFAGGQAAATLDANVDWVCAIISFKTAGAAAGGGAYDVWRARPSVNWSMTSTGDQKRSAWSDDAGIRDPSRDARADYRSWNK